MWHFRLGISGMTTAPVSLPEHTMGSVVRISRNGGMAGDMDVDMDVCADVRMGDLRSC